jgi:hypothetical protein
MNVEDEGWIFLGQDRDLSWVLVNRVVNLPVPKTWNLSTSSAISSFRKDTAPWSYLITVDSRLFTSQIS